MSENKDMSLQLTLNDSQIEIQKAVRPLLAPFDPDMEVIRFTRSNHLKRQVTIDSDSDDDKLSTPALAVMLFAPEKGTNNADQLRRSFSNPPWILHHCIKLQKKTSPGMTVAQQEFYQISQELPLWSVCTTMVGKEYLRINIFVVNFHKMVEFYRLVTNTEMESSKAGFCFFQMNSSDGQSVQLSLKHCPALKPYQLPGVCLNFRIKNIKSLQFLIQSDLTEVATSTYFVMDPDGNMVQLIDMDPPNKDYVYFDTGRICPKSTCDGTSIQSNSDSQDSGLFSDSDRGRKVENIPDIEMLPCDCKSVDNLVITTEEGASKSITSGKSVINPKGHPKQSEFCFNNVAYRTSSRKCQDCTLSSSFLIDDGAEFEDPWEGSQYNKSVNPGQEYKLLPDDKRKHNSNTQKKCTSKISNTTVELPDKLKRSVHTKHSVRVVQNIHRVNSCSSKERKFSKCIAVDTANSDANTRKNERPLGRKANEMGSANNNVIDHSRRTPYLLNHRDTKRSLGQLSQGYHILPDEGYHDPSTICHEANLPRSKSCEISSLEYFTESKARSIFQVISDKLLSKEKKFHCGNFKTRECLIQGTHAERKCRETSSTGVSDHLWHQNPKLLQVLGPPSRCFKMDRHNSSQSCTNIPVLSSDKTCAKEYVSSNVLLNNRSKRSRCDGYQTDNPDNCPFSQITNKSDKFPAFHFHKSKGNYTTRTSPHCQIGTLVCLSS